MSIDPLKIKKHMKVKAKDSMAPLTLHGVYLSNEGLIAMVKQGSESIIARNILLSDLEEVPADAKP